MNDIVGSKTLAVMGEASAYNDWILDAIQPNLKGSIVELGAGIGTFSKKIADL